jgi:hypothetical protein
MSHEEENCAPWEGEGRKEGGREEGRGGAYPHLLLVQGDDGLVRVGGYRAGRPLGMLLPDPFLGDGGQADGLFRPQVDDADAAGGGIAGGREGGREGRGIWAWAERRRATRVEGKQKSEGGKMERRTRRRRQGRERWRDGGRGGGMDERSFEQF